MNAMTRLPRHASSSMSASACLRLAMATVLMALAACSTTVPAPVLLSLPPAVTDATPSAAPPSAAASAPLLAVHRVGLPEYEVSRRVRYRADASTLAEWPNTYWAERIEIGVTREFVSALRRQLPGWTTCETECAETQPTLALQVDVVPMDFVRSAKELQARARIVVRAGTGAARPLASTERSYTLPAGADTPQAQAEAMTELIRQIAKDSATLVQTVPR
jgi:uncharacterized lipoprotein YmbA